MEDRYRKMSKIGVRNIDGFNQRVSEAAEKGETITRTVQTGFDRETGEAIFESEEFNLEPLPFIVVIIDEMADLMMVAGKDIEGAVQRLAQMARAAGIHLIMATQRPSVDVITGTIKANFPTRISLPGDLQDRQPHHPGRAGRRAAARQWRHALHGRRRPHPAPARPVRLRHRGRERRRAPQDRRARPTTSIRSPPTRTRIDAGMPRSASEFGGSGDELYDKAVNIVLQDKKASTSYIQRRLAIGYNKAASLIERMEKEGVISPANHSGKREILVGDGAAGY